MPQLVTAIGDDARMADDRDVLSSLPRTRPSRRSPKRDGSAGKPNGAGPEAGAPKRRRAAAKNPKSAPAGSRPKAARDPAVPPAGWATPDPPPSQGALENPVGTAVQAAGELARIGATVGAQALKGVLSRLPRL